MKHATRIAILLFFLPALSCRNQSGPAWKWTLEGRSYARPLLKDTRVYVVSQAGEIIAGNSSNGDKLWTTKVDGEILAEPAIQENRFFAATENGRIYALDASSGRILWQKREEGDGFTAPLTIGDDVLLAPSTNGTLYAMSCTDGRPLWNIPGNKKYSAGAIIQGSRIYVGGWAQDFLSINRDGAINWRFKAGQVIAEDAVINRNTVYFSGYDNYVHALDAISGRLIWRTAASQPTRPYLVRGSLIVASGRDFLVLRPEDGRIMQRLSPRSKILRCYVANDRLLFVTSKPGIYELDPGTPSIHPVIEPRFSIFKWAWQDSILVASDQLYGIYGFHAPK